MMDWESKFSSIVRETESNLAKVKHRLGSSRAADIILTGNRSSDAFGDSLRRPQGTPPIAPNHTYRHESLDLHVADRLGNLNISGEPSALSLEHSPGVLTLLSDKLDAQTRAIQSLVRTVNRLEEERDMSHGQIKNLKDELSNMQSRMAERGVDLQTEHKIDQWRRDVASEIHHLQSQLKYHRSTDEDGVNASQVSSFIREMHDLKRYFQDEMNSVRRDVESFKTRIVRVEADLLSVSSDNREFGRRHERLEQDPKSEWRNVRDMNERQVLMSPTDAHMRLGDQSLGRYEVAELKSSLKLLENKLANVEAKVKQCGNDIPAYPKPRKTRISLTNTTDLLSPLSSDVDLSDFSADDLDDDLKPKSKMKTKLFNANDELGFDGDDDDYDDYGLTTDDLLSTGVDTEDL